jgi:hypothetical protein
MAEDRDTCLDAGMDDYLSKPIQSRELQDALRRAGEWKRERGGPAAVDAPPPPAVPDVPAAAGAVLDPATLQSLRDMQVDAGTGLFQELLDLFRSDAEPRIAEMRAAIETGDAGALRHAAHGLKGAASNLGAVSLASACLALERMGKAGVMDGAAELMRGIGPEYQRTCAALEQEIEAIK